MNRKYFDFSRDLTDDELADLYKDFLSKSEELGTDTIIDKSVDSIQATIEAIINIALKDKVLFNSLINLILHINSCFDDKYYKSDVPVDGIYYSETLGKGFNMGNSVKYLSRYLADDSLEDGKKNNPKDLLKICHYLLFEYGRCSIN